MVSLKRKSKRQDRSRNPSPVSSISDRLASSTELNSPFSPETESQTSPQKDHGGRSPIASPVDKIKSVFKSSRRGDGSESDTQSPNLYPHALAAHSRQPSRNSSADALHDQAPSRASPQTRNTNGEPAVAADESVQPAGNSKSTTQPTRQRSTASRVGPTPLNVATVVSSPPASPAPATLVTPPTPVEHDASSLRVPSPTLAPDRGHQRAQSVVVLEDAGQSLPPGTDNISHQRSRSVSAATSPPNRMSQLGTSPLNPMIEQRGNSKGSREAAASGFFSSMISVAQNAASSLSGNLGNPLVPQQVNGQDVGSHGTPVEGRSQVSQPPDGVQPSSTKENVPARITIGNGNLELNHLDVGSQVPLEPQSPSRAQHEGAVMTQNPAIRDHRSSDPVRHTSPSQAKGNIREPDLRVQTASRGTEPFPTAQYADEDVSFDRNPRSRGVSAVTNISSPSSLTVAGSDVPVARSGSVKSRLTRSGRKGRTGSLATGSGVAAGIISASTGLASSPSLSDGVRVAGFPVATKKRNRDFHTTFRNIPLDDDLVDDYGCALQKEILLQGRMYVSVGHLCFYSNIFGWVTQLTISFDEVMSLEKRNTAVVFPNAIAIQTLHNKYFFASFISRDSVFDLLVALWRVGHPNLHVTDNLVSLAKAHPLAASRSRLDATGEDSEGSYSHDEDEQVDSADGSSCTESDDEVEREKAESKDQVGPHGPGNTNGVQQGAEATRRSTKSAEGGLVNDPNAAPSTGANQPNFPGPRTHAPTECDDQDKHYDKMIKEDVINAPLGQVYSLIFGAQSAQFMGKFMTENQKVTEMQMEDKAGLSLEHPSRTSSYIKPLGGSIGPSKTKCNVTEEVERLDLEKSASVVITTLSPDVPSGNSFSVKTRYCMMWGENNTTRVIVNCAIEWTAKSWLKSAIEKGAVDGQVGFVKDLFAAVTAAATAAKAAGARPARRLKKKKRQEGDSSQTARTHTRHLERGEIGEVQRSRRDSIYEALLDGFGTLFDVIKPIFGGTLHGFIIVSLLIATLIRTYRIPSNRVWANDALSTPANNDANCGYELAWKADQGELFDWLEQRIGLKRQKQSGSHLRVPKASKPSSGQAESAGLDYGVEALQKHLDVLAASGSVEDTSSS